MVDTFQSTFVIIIASIAIAIISLSLSLYLIRLNKKMKALEEKVLSFKACPFCGEKLKDGAKFCGKCGKEISNAAEYSSKKKKIRVKKIISSSVAAILILGIGFVSLIIMPEETVEEYYRQPPTFEETLRNYETISLGRYKDENIEWIVLDKESGKALIITKYIIEYKPYNEAENTDYSLNLAEDTTWETCTLRQWLNDDFYTNAFTEQEKSEVLYTNVVTPVNPDYKTDGGNPTYDKVFLLSEEEAMKYFESDNERKSYYTDYVSAKTESNSDAKTKASHSWYLRSPGEYQNNVKWVTDKGNIGDVNGFRQITVGSSGIRPAMWITL